MSVLGTVARLAGGVGAQWALWVRGSVCKWWRTQQNVTVGDQKAAPTALIDDEQCCGDW